MEKRITLSQIKASFLQDHDTFSKMVSSLLFRTPSWSSRSVTLSSGRKQPMVSLWKFRCWQGACLQARNCILVLGKWLALHPSSWVRPSFQLIARGCKNLCQGYREWQGDQHRLSESGRLEICWHNYLSLLGKRVSSKACDVHKQHKVHAEQIQIGPGC